MSALTPLLRIIPRQHLEKLARLIEIRNLKIANLFIRHTPHFASERRISVKSLCRCHEFLRFEIAERTITMDVDMRRKIEPLLSLSL